MLVRSIHSEMGVDHLYQQVHALQANQQAFVDGVYQEVTGCKSEVLRLSEDFRDFEITSRAWMGTYKTSADGSMRPLVSSAGPPV